METEENSKMETLLERFFAGETSLAEEKELYAFFEKPGLSEKWKRYKPLFGFFATDLPDTAAVLSPAAAWCDPLDLPPATLPRPTSYPTTRKIGMKILRIAGACVAVFLLGLLLYTFLPREEAAFDPYEGSYLVRGGIRISDPRLIRTELNATLCRVASLEKEMERKMQAAQPEKTIPRMADNQLKVVYTRLLSCYPEGFVRNEARRMLGLGPGR